MNDYIKERNEAFSDGLISRQAAIDFIKEHSYIEQGMMIAGIEEALNEIPNIQSKQKTGHWVCLDNDELAYGCSACRSVSLRESKYCPNCGAYMKGESNDEATSN